MWKKTRVVRLARTEYWALTYRDMLGWMQSFYKTKVVYVAVSAAKNEVNELKLILKMQKQKPPSIAARGYIINQRPFLKRIETTY